jgi:DinB superfamily
MNPYASQLGDRDAMQMLAESGGRLRSLAQVFGERRINEPLAPGKWSPREVLIHLADCELAFGFRYRQALGEENHVIQPFDQDLWAKSYSAYKAEQALETFTTLRNWNLALLRGLNAEQMAQPVTHPERGRMTFKVLIETAAGHDINHIQQLEAAVRKSAA